MEVWKSHVTVIPALDFFRAAKTVPEYLAKFGPEDMHELVAEMKWIWAGCELIDATLRENGGYREGPYMTYNVLTDETVMFFKCTNNGNTVVISRRPMDFPDFLYSFPLEWGTFDNWKKIMAEIAMAESP